MHNEPRTSRVWLKRLALAVAALLAVCAVAFVAYTSDYYHAETQQLPQSDLYQVADQTDTLDFTPAAQDGEMPGVGIVLYPGGKVDPYAYASLAAELAERGYFVSIAKAPFNLAFFNIGAAGEIMQANPDVQSWWVAGHSLGGVAAAEFAAENAQDVQGIVFLASYSSADLSETGLEALSVYGSEDGVLNMEAYEEGKPNLPARFAEIVIEGGNHAGFGNYGPQEGDGEASISAQEQQEQTADAISAATLVR